MNCPKPNDSSVFSALKIFDFQVAGLVGKVVSAVPTGEILLDIRLDGFRHQFRGMRVILVPKHCANRQGVEKLPEGAGVAPELGPAAPATHPFVVDKGLVGNTRSGH